VAHLQVCRPPKTISQLCCFLGMLNFFYRKLLLLGHHYTTFFPAPESNALISLPIRRDSTRPLKSARQVYHVPLYWHTLSQLCNLLLSQTPPLLPRMLYYNNVSTTPGSLLHSSPINSTQCSRNTAPTIANS
jgi:hypothetical protein